MASWLKVDMHLHTQEDPEDGHRMVDHSARRLILTAASRGFEVLSITNHNQMLIGRRLEAFARRHGILLIPGVEATLLGRHVLLYNFADYHPAWKDPGTVIRSKGPEQLVVAPHPFYPVGTAVRERLFTWKGLFDALEVTSLFTGWIDFNQKAKRVSQKSGLPLIGNSDTHFLYQLGTSYSLVYAEKDVLSVLKAVREGKVKVVQKPLSSFAVAKWFVLKFLRDIRYRMPSLSNPKDHGGGEKGLDAEYSISQTDN